MADEPQRPRAPTPPPPGTEGAGDDRGIGDFVRRAGSVFFDVARNSKDDVLRAATGEIRGWLDHLDLDKELMKALSKMTVEITAQVRFKPNDEGQVAVDTAKTDVKVKRDTKPE